MPLFRAAFSVPRLRQSCSSSNSALSLRSLQCWLSTSSSSSLLSLARPVTFASSALSSSPRPLCPLSAPPAARLPRRHFAAPAAAAKGKEAKKGAKKEDAPPPDPNRPIDVSFIHALKADAPPKLKADSEYPDWLFDSSLFSPPSLAELRVRRDNGEQLTDDLSRRLNKLERKRKIKQNNDNTRKG